MKALAAVSIILSLSACYGEVAPASPTDDAFALEEDASGTCGPLPALSGGLEQVCDSDHADLGGVEDVDVEGDVWVIRCARGGQLTFDAGTAQGNFYMGKPSGCTSDYVLVRVWR